MLRSFLFSCGVILAGLAVSAHCAFGQTRPDKASLRLIDGGRQSDGRLMAGVEIRLWKNAKTYWRTPGDSGVAPDFNFSQSENVADVRVNFPAPVRFTDGGGTAIGYKGGVIFPLVVTPKDPNRSVRLALTLNYAICDTLCLPAQGEARLEIGRGEMPPDLRDAMGFVPQSGEGPVALELEDKRLVLTLGIPPAAQDVDLFIEGPDASWALPLPSLEKREGDQAIFVMPLEGAPKGAAWAGQMVTLTLVRDGKGEEMRVRLPE